MNRRKPDYYRIEMVSRGNGRDEVTVRKIEQGEERVVTGERYIRDGRGVPYKFDTEKEAIDWVNKYIVAELIDEDYRLPDQRKFLNTIGMKEVYGQKEEQKIVPEQKEKVVGLLKA